MKKSLILLSICSAVLTASCGTSSYYASSGFDDGIYYRPDRETRAEAAADNEKVSRLVEQTRQEAARFSDTIIISSTNSTIDVPYTPDTQYTIMFDNQPEPSSQVNLNFYFDDWYPGYGYMDYYSYWDWRYWNVFGPSWYRWGWYDPWYWGWYGPWYGSWNFSFGLFGWYLPGYWGPGYWGWYDPWFGPWGYPATNPRPVYYGKRDTGGVRAGGLSGGRTMASERGTTVRNEGRGSKPSMSLVRGRGTATAEGTTAKTATRSRTLQAATSNVNLGERYVNRGSGSHSASRATTNGRAAYNTANTAGSYRRPVSTESGFRRTTSTAQEFRNPFENRTRTSVARDYGTSFNRNTSTDRQTSFSRQATINRNTVNTSTSRSFNTGRTVSRSSGGTSFRSSGTRGGGGVRR